MRKPCNWQRRYWSHAAALCVPLLEIVWTEAVGVQVHDMATEHERQQCETQRQQTTAIHELMDETNDKLKKMQDDYDQLLQSTVITASILASVCVFVSAGFLKTIWMDVVESLRKDTNSTFLWKSRSHPKFVILSLKIFT